MKISRKYDGFSQHGRANFVVYEPLERKRIINYLRRVDRDLSWLAREAISNYLKAEEKSCRS